MRDRSVVLALVLTVLLGPLGLFYASVPGALALIALAAVGVVPTFGFVLVFVWPASIAWAVVAANAKHKAFTQETALHGPVPAGLH